MTYLLGSMVTAVSAAATNFAGLATCRFLLGMFEATIAPSFVLITQTWWRRREQVRQREDVSHQSG